MTLNPAYAVDGGRGPASMFRAALWASTSGASGIVQARDLTVSALAVPGGAITINPGGALMATRYTTQQSQTYMTTNDAAEQLVIPPTGSSGGRTDYIILRVQDWHYDASAEPADPENALYCSFARVNSLQGIAYPYIPLAKVVIPSSTGAITNAMITDLRKVALPRTERVVRPNATFVSETETLTSKTGEYFPNAGGEQTVFIPAWATRVKLRGDWFSVLMPAGNCTGRVWVSFGDWNGTTWGSNSHDYGFDNVQATNASRMNFSVVDDMYIPAGLRGRDVHFQLWAKTLGSVGPQIDGQSGSSLDLLFEEIADPSDS